MPYVCTYFAAGVRHGGKGKKKKLRAEKEKKSPSSRAFGTSGQWSMNPGHATPKSRLGGQWDKAAQHMLDRELPVLNR